ncbi:MAG: hypothetical protein MK008_09405 [Bdellovibrionales bacterium]|nr:hypothetical protein [Bdellovibrionales bacterium]
MKAIIFTLAVAGFMSSAQAGVYKKGNDPKVHNMKTQECAHKQSGSLFAKTAAKKESKNQRPTTRGRKAVQ